MDTLSHPLGAGCASNSDTIMKFQFNFLKLRRISIVIGAWFSAVVGVLLVCGGILFLLNLYTISH